VSPVLAIYLASFLHWRRLDRGQKLSHPGADLLEQLYVIRGTEDLAPRPKVSASRPC
jgi:hypothetical protein